jgi:hypothetical protein
MQFPIVASRQKINFNLRLMYRRLAIATHAPLPPLQPPPPPPAAGAGRVLFPLHGAIKQQASKQGRI